MASKVRNRVRNVSRMDRRIVYDHHRLFRERLTKGIKTGDHHAGVYGACKHKWMQVVLAMHQPEHIDPPIFPGRQLDDALGLLPSRGNRGIKRKARCIKIIQRALALIFLLLQRCTCTFGLGKGVRVAEAFERFSHPLPSKTGSFCETFQRRKTEALLGCVGSSLSHLFERTGVFFDRVLRQLLFVWGELGWSATARVIMQTLGAMLFPFFDPG